jgi:pilus assembly protein CpaE
MGTLNMIVIDSNEKSREQLEELMLQFNHVNLVGTFDNLLAGYEAAIIEKPHIVFIDLTENIDLGIETIEKISSKNKFSLIFVSSENVQTEVVIRAMRAGAREFISKPVIIEDLSSALNKARNSMDSDDDDAIGQIISVFSNKGGIGKTTIATNLALKLAEITDKRVCLVDLNLQLGDITTFLDVDPSFDISYVVTHLSRIDESFLLSSLEKYKDTNLYILADPPNVEQAEEISSDDIISILNMLRELFAYVVVDTSSSFDIKTLTCLDLSDMIMLVSMINLPSIRNCQRCLDLFMRLEYKQEKIKLVINRYMTNDEITAEDVEDALGQEIYWKVPNDYFSVMSAINKGVPIADLAQNKEIDLSFTKLAAKIADVIVRTKGTVAESESFLDKLGLGFLSNLFNK